MRHAEIMVIDRHLLDILVCPDDHSPLEEADDALLAKVNQAIAQGRAKTKGGQVVSQPLAAGLGRRGKTVLYPIVDGIPVLLVEEAIVLGQIG
jgi:uncharacterized protein YbaR (Trm112 family)